FISPWSAFVVLGAVVAAIMLHVATADTYLAPEAVPAAAQGPLLDRYFLTAPAGGAEPGLVLSPIQRMAFFAAPEPRPGSGARQRSAPRRPARRMGLFLYLFVAALVLALFALIAMQGQVTLFSGGTP
ncbi:MAG: hypothetical protein ACK446_07320, partial [Rhodobacterales bacterium]